MSSRSDPLSAHWAAPSLGGRCPAGLPTWRGSCSGRRVLRSLLEGVDLALATAFADPCTGGALVWARFACAQLRLRYIEGTEARRGAVPLLLPCGLAPKWACIA